MFHRVSSKVLAYAISLLVKCLLKSLRIEKIGDPINEAGIVGFLHGEQLPLLSHRPSSFPLATAVSLSKDGDLQTIVMSSFLIHSVRGSSSRGGAKVLRGLIRWFHHHQGVILIAVDGPRGPWGHLSPGAVYLAQKLDAPLWFCRVSCQWAIQLRSWDRFVIPLPFSKVKITTYRCLTPDELLNLLPKKDPKQDTNT